MRFHVRRNLFTAALCLACACGPDNSNVSAPQLPEVQVATKTELRSSMRQLWAEQVTLNHGYLVSAIAHLSDKDMALARLFQNQLDLGNAYKPFYGEAAGDKLAALLHDHVATEVQVIAAADAGDSVALTTAKTRWRVSVDVVATYLADNNPYVDLARTKLELSNLVSSTLTQMNARLSADWAADVTAYDAGNAAAQGLADDLSNGIALQHPMNLKTPSLSTRNEDLHVAMRSVWQTRAAWTRFYLISAVAGLQDASTAANRLQQTQDQLAGTLVPYVGEIQGNDLAALLRDEATLTTQLVADTRLGDTSAALAEQQQWSQVDDQVATFLAGANPSWNGPIIRSLLKTQLDLTLAESNARFSSDWAADVKAFDAADRQILVIADALSSGVASQFPGMVQ